MQFNNYEFEILTKSINKNINVYKLDLEILNNLKFLKKKDGSVCNCCPELCLLTNKEVKERLKLGSKII